MRTNILSLLSISALALSLAACGGSVDSELHGDDLETDTPGAAGSGNEEDDGEGGDADAGADSADDGGGKGDADIEPEPPTIAFACPGGTIEDGSNTLSIGGKNREFFADFPSDTSGPMGVVFAWHGFGDSWTNFRKIGLNPDADPNLPVIVLTPEDTKMNPPQGLGWDIRAGKPGESNIDIAFFEAMLGCLNEQQTIDSSRIYSLGFSAGSVFTALLHSRYPDLFAATVHQSGAWMNNPEETALVTLPFGMTIDWSWPDLNPADRGNVLMTHGGDTDKVGALGFNVFNLEDSAQAALPFLKAGNRTVIDCAHDKGHVLHPELSASMLVRYLTAHRAGAPSPFADGKLEGYPDSCTLRLP